MTDRDNTGADDTGAAGGFVWYELMTDDIARATAFYAKVTGATISPAQPPQPDGPMDYRMITTPTGHAGGALALTPAMLAEGARPGWYPYLKVDDVAQTLHAVAAEGAQVLMQPTTIAEGTFAFILDPWGAPLYLMRPIPREGAQGGPAFSRTNPGHACWNDWRGPDLHAAVAFYERHFGFSCKDFLDMGPGGVYRFIDLGGQRVGGMVGAADAAPASWMTYFKVPDTAAARAAVLAAGGMLPGVAMQVPGGEWVCAALDPSGARFGLAGADPAGVLARQQQQQQQQQ